MKRVRPTRRHLARASALIHNSVEPLESRRLMAVLPLATVAVTTALDSKTTLNLNNYVVEGTAGNDVITVNYSNSTVTGRRLTVQLNGDPGYIVPLTATQGVSIKGLEGHDYIKFNGAQKVFMYGGPGNDILTGSTGNDNLYGEDGDDVMDGELGLDVMQGGAGNDTADYSRRVVGVMVTLDGQANDGQAGESDNVANDTEGVKGSSAADQIFGNSANNYFYGNGGDDLIRGGNGLDFMRGGAGNDQLFTDAGFYDEIYGDDGSDKIYGGSGPDYLRGGNGDDVIVSIGGSQTDYVWGESGFDSFWVDAETTERVYDVATNEATRALHRVAGFETQRINGTNYGALLRELLGQNFVDPLPLDSSSTVQSFIGTPLFTAGSNGPSPDDVNQGNIGDCYFLAPLSSIAKTHPNVIKQAVVELGDGTYAVEMRRDGVKKYIRVDADLVVGSGGTPIYSHWQDTGRHMWVPIMEKAWAYFRNSTGTYAGIDGGWAYETYTTLGMPNDEYDPFSGLNDSPAEYMNRVASLLDSGYSLTLCTDGGFYNGVQVLEKDHCYMVDHVDYDANGVAVSLTLRNPWGNDGKSAEGANDGYITLSRSAARNATAQIVYGRA